MMEKSEIKKQVKVIDMMVTMHSILAARYALRSQIIEIGMLGISILLVSVAFLDPEILSNFHIEPNKAHIVIGLSSILIFFMSVLSLIVDWKGRSVHHKDGFFTLVKLKTEWRNIHENFEEIDKRDLQEFINRSSLIVSQLFPIPDNCFNNLKSKHIKKIELSKMIGEHPGGMVFLLKLKMFFISNCKIFCEKDEKT
jgi:hypothetical protein